MRRKSLKRKSRNKIIICCEGPTESSYLDSIRIHKRLQDTIIEILEPISMPWSIVDRIIAHVHTLKKKSQFDPASDQAWAVFDGDEHIAHNLGKWNAALEKAKHHGIKIAVSNPCIEFWFLIHYEKQTSNLHRKQANTLLKKHCPKYAKGAERIDGFEQFSQTSFEEAKKRAIKLHEIHKKNNLPDFTNPSSSIYHLVDQILLT